MGRVKLSHATSSLSHDEVRSAVIQRFKRPGAGGQGRRKDDEINTLFQGAAYFCTMARLCSDSRQEANSETPFPSPPEILRKCAVQLWWNFSPSHACLQFLQTLQTVCCASTLWSATWNATKQDKHAWRKRKQEFQFSSAGLVVDEVSKKYSFSAAQTMAGFDRDDDSDPEEEDSSRCSTEHLHQEGQWEQPSFFFFKFSRLFSWAQVKRLLWRRIHVPPRIFLPVSFSPRRFFSAINNPPSCFCKNCFHTCSYHNV